MANRINEYPDRMICPLVNSEISADDCVENQTYAEGIIKPDTLPTEYKQKPNWRKICLDCKYHEID